MKSNFKLDAQLFVDKGHSVTITNGNGSLEDTYVGFHRPDGYTIGWIKSKDLETFAVNILKSIGSNKLYDTRIKKS